MTDKPMELPPEGEKVLAWWDLGENEAPMLLRHFAASGWEQWDYESCCWERGPAQPPTRWVPLSLVRMAREIAEAGWKIVAQQRSSAAASTSFRNRATHRSTTRALLATWRTGGSSSEPCATRAWEGET